MSDIFNVRWGARVAKQLKRIPSHIAAKFYTWVNSVQIIGMIQTRKCQAYHDEPLQGIRKGQRSVRMNRSYRVIYEVSENNKIKVVEVLEITKHEY